MDKEGMCQVYKVEELKRYGQYRICATSLGRMDKYEVRFLTTNKDEYPMGTWVAIKIQTNP